MSNIIVTFAEGQIEAVADETLEQWAYGQKLQFVGLDLPANYQVDFSNWEFCGDSIPRIGDADGVSVPTEVLTSGRNVYAFVWIQTAGAGRRLYRATIRVKPGPMPDPGTPSPEEESALAQAIEALNTTAAAAQEVVDAAERGDFDGQAGFSPSVTITEITGGHRITITDAEHPEGQSFDVLDGTGGSGGGMSAAAITLLETILRAGVYTSDQSDNIDALIAALSGGYEDDITVSDGWLIIRGLENEPVLSDGWLVIA